MDAEAVGLASYQRVAEAIRDSIRSGVLQPGDKLPGNRALADEYGVALGTGQKALRLLQDEGWLVATPAVGVFVKANDARADHEVGNDAIERVHHELDSLHAALADISDRLERLEAHQKERNRD